MSNDICTPNVADLKFQVQTWLESIDEAAFFMPTKEEISYGIPEMRDVTETALEHMERYRKQMRSSSKHATEVTKTMVALLYAEVNRNIIVDEGDITPVPNTQQ